MLMGVHLVVSGRVQGVWFRAGTREQALQLGLCGWVKNCPDGTVEIHAEGGKEALEHFISGAEKVRLQLKLLISTLSGYRLNTLILLKSTNR